MIGWFVLARSLTQLMGNKLVCEVSVAWRDAKPTSQIKTSNVSMTTTIIIIIITIAA
jgi:hypothetical protein